MMLKHAKHFHGPARVLMSILFLVSGTGKLANVEGTQKYMEAYGVPGYLLWPAAALEIGCGTMLWTGYRTRQLGIILAGWCLLTAMIFHTEFGDQNQKINFMKNMVMAGGFLVLADHGGSNLSLRQTIESDTDYFAGAPGMSLRIRFGHADHDREEHLLPLWWSDTVVTEEVAIESKTRS